MEDVVVNFRAIGMATDEAFALVAVAIGEFAARNAGSGVWSGFFAGFLRRERTNLRRSGWRRPRCLPSLHAGRPSLLVQSGTGIVTNPS